MTNIHRKCVLYKQAWESHTGQEYTIMRGFDHKFVADLADCSDDDFLAHLKVYFADEWYEKCRWSLQAFCKNYNKFAPKVPKKKTIQVQRKQMIHCLDCETDHAADEPCPVMK